MIKDIIDITIYARTALIGHIGSKQLLLGMAEFHLRLVGKIIGLGHIVAYTVRFQAEAGALAKVAQRPAAGKDAGSLPCLPDLLGELVETCCSCSLKTKFVY